MVVITSIEFLEEVGDQSVLGNIAQVVDDQVATLFDAEIPGAQDLLGRVWAEALWCIPRIFFTNGSKDVAY